MKHVTDEHGLVFTASNQESCETFNELVTAYMGLRPETGKLLKTLLTRDPDMPMALCAKGYFAKLIGSASHAERAKRISESLAIAIDELSITPRERLHCKALSLWCEGRLDEASNTWEAILLDYPLDGLAVKLAHSNHFYSGDGRRMRDSIARVLPHWHRDHPHYGFVLGMYAFGLEESGQYDAAERHGRMAVEINQYDAWSIHAVAHVMEMTGQHRQGIEWVQGLCPSWSTANNFRFHLYWHQCLFHLECGDYQSVLDIFDEHLVSDLESDFYLDVCNATSLLWRLEMHGVDVADRWKPLSSLAVEHNQDRELIFVSLHYFMAAVSAGDGKNIEQMMTMFEVWARDGTTQGTIIAAFGLDIAKSLIDARNGDYLDALNRLERIRYTLDAMGGSKAQRDVFAMIMLDAAKKSGDLRRARALFADRVASHRLSTWSWRGYAQVLDSLGDTKGAEAALAELASVADG